MCVAGMMVFVCARPRAHAWSGMDSLACDKRGVGHILYGGLLACGAVLLGGVWAVCLFDVEWTSVCMLGACEAYGIFMCMSLTIMTFHEDKTAKCPAPMGRDQGVLELSDRACGGICVPPHASLHV
jgi:hypothetical protein